MRISPARTGTGPPGGFPITKLHQKVMSDEKHGRSEAYDKARSAFDGLSMDERASFLVESVVAMMAEGVGQAGKIVSEVLDDLAQKMEDCGAEEQAGGAEAGGPEKAKEPAARKPRAAKKKSSGGQARKGTGGTRSGDA